MANGEIVLAPNTRDGIVLHFLKELPAWVIIFAVMMILIGVNYLTPTDFLPRLIDQAFGGLLTALFGVARRAATPAGDTNIKTDSVNPATMDNATVNVGESFNAESEKKGETKNEFEA